jgi:hypothetical protein
MRWHVTVDLISFHNIFRKVYHEMPILVILIGDYPNPVDDQQRPSYLFKLLLWVKLAIAQPHTMWLVILHMLLFTTLR